MDIREKARPIPVVGFVWDVLDVYFGKRVGRAAAELTYFLLLTIFPILIGISAFLDTLNLKVSAVLDQAADFLPGSVMGLFREYLNYIDNNHSQQLFYVGLFLALLFASGALRSLMNIVQEIYDWPPMNGIKQVIYSVLFSLLLLISVYLSMAVIITGNWFFRTIGNFLGFTDLAERLQIYQYLKYLLLLGLLLLVILVLYRVASLGKKPRPMVVPGAMAASVALAIASWFFSMMVSHSIQYSLVYGSLASLAILLVWMYLCGNIIILGTVFNFVFCQRRRAKKALKQQHAAEAAQQAEQKSV